MSVSIFGQEQRPTESEFSFRSDAFGWKFNSLQTYQHLALARQATARGSEVGIWVRLSSPVQP